jgi:hypothetical protein
VVNLEEATLLDEEVTHQDLDQKEEEPRVAGTTRTGTANSATFTNFKGMDRKNAAKGSKKTNLAETPKDGPTGQGSTSWMRIWRPRQSTPSTMRTSDTRTKKAHLTLLEFNISQEPQPFPSNFWVFSKELDDPLIQAPSIIPQLILSLCTVSIPLVVNFLKTWRLFMGTATKLKY